MRRTEISRRIAALLLSVMLAAEAGTGSVQAAELNQVQTASGIQNAAAAAQTTADGEMPDTISGAVPEKERTVRTESEELQTQEELDYVLGRPMTEEEREEQIRLMEEYGSRLVQLEPDAEVDRVHNDEEEIAFANTLPSAYDARDNGWITSVKNQNPFGTCWAFSSINLLEASLKKKQLVSDADLSEFHLAYYTYNFVTDPLGGTAGDSNYYGSSGYLNVGGNYTRSSNALMAWLGAASESAVPYVTVESSLPATVASAYGQNVALLKNTREINIEDISLAKQAIMDYGSIGIMYYAPTTSTEIEKYFNEDTAAQNCYVDLGVNHAVSVVGWNDDYSADNFIHKPSSNGAWLVKNSWGTWYGDKGYFWLSYEDATINDTVFAFDAVQPGAYDNNYFYDGSGSGGTIGVPNKFTGANVFEAHAKEGKKEILKAVSFYLGSANANYSVQIYKNPSDAGKPSSGTPMLSSPITGTGTYQGYYTVELDQQAKLDYGDTFAIAVTVTTTGNNYARLGYEGSGNSICTSVASVSAGQSLYQSGSSWYEFGTRYGGNFRIKGYTVNTTEESGHVEVTGIYMPVTSGTLVPGGEVTVEASVVPSDAANQKINWSSENASVATVDENGKVKAITSGTVGIIAETDEGKYSARYQLTVEEEAKYKDIKISGVSSIAEIGASSQFTATVYPADAPDASVTWTTSNADVVSVDDKGMVTAKGIGTANITATSNGDSRLSATIAVNVPNSQYNRIRSFVNRMYTVALNRPADNSGAAYWTQQLLGGAKDGAAVAKGFVLSMEMERRNLSNSQYVDMLYKTFFDRAADASGKAYWMNLLENGVSRAYVFKGFCHSQEFTNICSSYGIKRGTIKLTENRDQNHNITMYVYRCYERTLGREPDVSGLNFWTGQILTKKRTPVDVAGNFVFSTEFKNKKLSDEEYVKVLYRMFFDREYNAPGTDPNGIKFWLNELKTGKRDRYKVFTGFANSEEFRKVLKTFGL